jgi:hypothetical protein
MVPRRRYKLADLPEEGSVFALPLANGQTGICRVLRKTIQDVPRVLVAASDWIGDGPPPLNDPAIFRTLVTTHHKWNNEPVVIWVATPPPKEFKFIGKIVIDAKEARMESNSFAGWEYFAIQVLAQWRWDNEREAVLAEDDKKRASDLAKQAEASRKRAEYLSTVSLSDLLAKDLFPGWSDYPPPKARKGCKEIIHNFICALAGAKAPLGRDFVSSELERCVKALNHFDTQNKNFIETIEREDLCAVLEEIVSAAKYRELIDKVEDWRDW